MRGPGCWFAPGPGAKGKKAMPLSGWTSHEDKFAIENCPPAELMPWLDEEWFRIRGISDAPFNAGSYLLDRHLSSPVLNKTAMIGEEETWSYADLIRRVSALSTVLQTRFAIRPGRRIVLHARNSPWLATAALASLRLGAVTVMCPPAMNMRELASAVDTTSGNLCLFEKDLIQDLGALSSRPTVFASLEEIETVTLERMQPEAGFAEQAAATAPTDPALILFTSGSTGAPKAAVTFHREIVAVLDSLLHLVPMTASDISIGTPSLGFAYGLCSLLLRPVAAGATMILNRDMRTLPNLLQKHRATQIYSTPAAYQSLLEVASYVDFSSLRFSLSAGENLTDTLTDQWRRSTNLNLLNGLGTTETVAFLIGSAPDGAPQGSTGRVLPGFKARVLDEDGQVLGPGRIGRLAIRGPVGCKYLANLEAQRQRVLEGWTLTGDLFEYDSQGVFWSRGRADDLIIRFGLNIPPIEIEAKIMEHPSVTECAVIGKFDAERQTNAIIAYIVLNQAGRVGEAAASDARENAARAEIRRLLTAHFSQHKVPDQFVFMPALPRSGNGKLQRFKLRGEQADAIA
jgi:2-aminobenzoate-CoA ligase